MRILLVSATAPELRQTTEWLDKSGPESSAMQKPESSNGRLQTERLITGVGQLQTAYCLLKKIYTHRPGFIVQAGIGGSPDAGHIGKVFGIRSERLADLGVEVDALFYPEDHEPALDHEYQFDLDTVDGMVAFDRTVAFLRNYVR